MKKHKNKIIAAVLVAAALVFIYWWGGSSPGLRGWKPAIGESSEKALHGSFSGLTDSTAKTDGEDSGTSAENGGKNGTVRDKYMTNPVPEGKPLPIEPQDAVISDKIYTCILSVRCDTILNNISWLDKEKISLVPRDGILFAEQAVTFYEGESVFNVLAREMKKNKIHLEFENTPIFNSAYIEGIGNLYEFDCGELSGWMYKVNGWFPNYGCSRYRLCDGDRVEWIYTCDLGSDIGDDYSNGNGMKQ